MGKAPRLLSNHKAWLSERVLPRWGTAAGVTAIKTHRDVKDLLCVVQHTDPDGNVPPRGHGWRSVPRVQCTDAKCLGGPQTLSCTTGHLFWLWLHHGALTLLTAQPAEKQIKKL